MIFSWLLLCNIFMCATVPYTVISFVFLCDYGPPVE